MKTQGFFSPPIKGLLGCLVLVSLLGSCDLLRFSPFEVARWSPGPGFHQDPGALEVSVGFTHDPDRLMVEHSFSLTEDDQAVKGAFEWEGRTLRFTPFLPLEGDRDYRITILADAADDRGLSMDKKFEGAFTTRGEGERPRILGVDPGDGGIIGEARREIRVEFSRPLRLGSCIEEISLSPAITGVWSLEGEDRIAVFTPGEPWEAGTSYRLRFSADFSDARGRALGKDFSSSFILGEDFLPPCLEGAYALDREGEVKMRLVPSEQTLVTAENFRWEAAYRLRLDFSEAVDTGSLKSRLSVEPSLKVELESPPGYTDSAVFRFTEGPEFSKPFLIRLDAGVRDDWGNESAEPVIFRVIADGPFSKPPALIGIRLPLAPALIPEDGGEVPPPEELYRAADFSVEAPFGDLPIEDGEGRYPYTKQVPGWIELYFDLAPGAELELLSLMNLFRVEAANNALSFSPRFMSAGDFTFPEKRPGWEAYYRVEVRGIFVNTVSSGVVSFLIGSGLQDTLGNRSGKTWKIPLLK
jgi:hypothetical protein